MTNFESISGTCLSRFSVKPRVFLAKSLPCGGKGSDCYHQIFSHLRIIMKKWGLSSPPPFQIARIQNKVLRLPVLGARENMLTISNMIFLPPFEQCYEFHFQEARAQKGLKQKCWQKTRCWTVMAITMHKSIRILRMITQHTYNICRWLDSDSSTKKQKNVRLCGSKPDKISDKIIQKHFESEREKSCGRQTMENMCKFSRGNPGKIQKLCGIYGLISQGGKIWEWGMRQATTSV